MTPLFFGDSARRLFGVLLEPRVPVGDAAVLLCYPLGKEYMRSHWALRQLATQLVRTGIPTLRFDYRGTGDSAGDSGEGDVEAWCDDIATAAAELRDTAGAHRISLVGLRFGATLAALASARLADEGLALTDLVLWDPVVSGAHYLEQLRELHEQLLRSDYYFAAPRHGAEDERLGFLYPPAMARSIAAVDLLRLEAPIAAERVHLVVSEPLSEYAALRPALAAQRGVELRCHDVGGAPGRWGELGEIEEALLAGELPRRICESLAAEVAS